MARAFWVALFVTGTLAVGFELYRLMMVFQSANPLVEWMASFNGDVSFYASVLMLTPAIVWWTRPVAEANAEPAEESPAHHRPGRSSLPLWCDWGMGLLSILISILTSSSISGDVLAYHDEYSYLFQAQTYLEGSIVQPGFEPAPELFDQMHVLNEPGRFSSRYFPATGFWMAPFVWLGIPHWASRLAMALSTVCLTRAGVMLGGRWVGLMTGLLMAVTPGIVLFGQLLLAHHVCLLMLSLFLVSFLKATGQQPGQYRWHVVAGMALTAAMLSRPMTALGFSLPFGMMLLGKMIQQRDPKMRSGLLLSYGIPLMLGLTVLGVCNQAQTGSFFTTAYGRYTQQHTPRHGYGFYNRSRGEAAIQQAEEQGTPLPVLHAYDEWAEELTLSLAARNVVVRLITSWQWVAGLFSMLFVLVMTLGTLPAKTDRWWLVIGGIFCLHLVHVPYWFDGIFHWHYVFETAPLWILLLAKTLEQCVQLFVFWNRPQLVLVLLLFPGFGLFSSYVSFEPLWSANYWAAMGQVEFTQSQFDALDQAIHKERGNHRAVVVITSDPEDVHTDFVINHPRLQNDVLKVHDLRPAIGFEQIQEWFPDRVLLHYDQNNQQLRFIP